MTENSEKFSCFAADYSQFLQTPSVLSHKYIAYLIGDLFDFCDNFIKINKKLYILANNQNSLELLDVIKQEKDILEILSADSENLDKRSINEKFDNTLRTILRKTDEVEGTKKK